MKSGGDGVNNSTLLVADCPPGVGRMGEACYYLPDDFDPYYGRIKSDADECPVSKGPDDCLEQLEAKKKVKGWMEGRFPTGITGFGLGYYGSDEVRDGEVLRRWHGIGFNLSASLEPLTTGIANLSVSADANLGFGGGIEANGGIGPTFSIGLPAIVRAWGALKVRGNASSGGEGEGHTGWGLNPELGLSIFFVDLRWGLPAVAGGGETQQGNSFFAGVSVGLP